MEPHIFQCIAIFFETKTAGLEPHSILLKPTNQQVIYSIIIAKKREKMFAIQESQSMMTKDVSVRSSPYA